MDKIMDTAHCFKQYDIRGAVGVDLDPALAYRIGRAVVATLGGGTFVCGRDARGSSRELQQALHAGLRASGASVIDLELCGTEEVYFATGHLGATGGIMVTGSHNPRQDNGFKIVGAGSQPLSSQAFQQLRERTAREPAPAGQIQEPTDCIRNSDLRAKYVARVLDFVDPNSWKPLRVVTNAGNGAAGPTLDAVATALHARAMPIQFIRIHHDPNPGFPNGIPNPLLPENRPATARAVLEAGADFGVAWDGDFDRCFLFDETGAFVDGEYIVTLLAKIALRAEPRARIVHDTRVVRSIQSAATRFGGVAVPSPTGHAWIKAKMRDVGAVYGGEMSAHHYFRDFYYCDSGMIPWLLVAQEINRSGQRLSALVAKMRAAFPSSGEINFRLADPDAAMARVEAAFANQAQMIDRLDGISMCFGTWRFNLRRSNTEPVLRLNVESYADRELMLQAVQAVRAEIEFFQTKPPHSGGF